MSAIDFSIVVPVRDQQQAVESHLKVIADALVDSLNIVYEVIVVDDGSLDQTVAVVKSLAETDHRIKLVTHQQPRGIQVAGETGVRHASGEFAFVQESLCPISIDDLKQLLQIAKDPTVVMARAETVRQPVSAQLHSQLQAIGIQFPGQLGSPMMQRSILRMIRLRHLKQVAVTSETQVTEGEVRWFHSVTHDPSEGDQASTPASQPAVQSPVVTPVLAPNYKARSHQAQSSLPIDLPQNSVTHQPKANF
ncbi:MAG: hypothetical protein CBB71_21890 [Rhodopirellula sp. TMED11]|nr:MAG: hypothetical protein CBB71_21890 [Rhodopirellula sp. TMED11]